MAAMGADINVAGPSSSSSSPKNPKRFEIEKWNAVALRAWGTKPNPHSPLDALAVSSMVRVKIYEDIVVDGCAICRSHIMDLCELDLRQITASGSSRNMATKAAISYSILYSIFPNAIFRVFGTTMGTDF
ncbi:RING-box protein 1 [Ananas comosus]|uniref:RING-box protein 1 n=1 Tax=Ananas comosus TaxID=4615 RepID=A0A199VBK3_ANACO|nr:RING-box protein 1 [Ananas comosus]